jgi:predicted MPP superfamily phosphohydrolase
LLLGTDAGTSLGRSDTLPAFMRVHPQLWPAVAGTTIGLALLALAILRYVRQWPQRSRAERSGRGLALLLFAVGYGLNVYAWLIEPRMLVVRRVEVASPRWRGPPLAIAVISDTHVGSPHVDARRMASIVERTNALHPDLVVLLGDYAGSHEPAAERQAAERTEILAGVAAFARLQAPFGVAAVLGNHDTWYGLGPIVRTLEAAGVTVLRNQHVVKDRPGGSFVIAGIADDITGNPDFPGALAGAPAIDTIVLSHSPDPFPNMPAAPALMLAGHTHCGQVSVPFLGRPITLTRSGQRYACGRSDEGGRVLYTTAGVGTSLLPVRFGNPPEIVLLTLRAAAPRN